MKCDEVQAKLDEFIDNELDDPSSLLINEHLTNCLECNQEVVALRQLKTQLVSLDMPLLNTDFDTRLQERINKVNSKQFLPGLLAIAASIALAVPLIDYFKYQAPKNAPNDLTIEFYSIGKASIHYDDSFHKWTKSFDSEDSYYCGSSAEGSNCTLSTESAKEI